MPADIANKVEERSVWFITACFTGFDHELANHAGTATASLLRLAVPGTQKVVGNDKALVLKLDFSEVKTALHY
jgi:hypothetical protein